MVDSDGGPGCGCKLGRVAEDWDLDSVDDDLAAAWLSDGASLRSLAATFNRRLLRRAMTDAGHPPIDGEVANLHRLLTSDEVSPGMTTQATNRLAENGVDVKAVESDFISYQTVNRHLKNCLGVSEDDRRTPLDIDQAKDRIFSLQHRTMEVTEQTISQVRRTAGTDFEDFDVYVDISARCTECGAQLDVEEALEGETCRCSGN